MLYFELRCYWITLKRVNSLNIRKKKQYKQQSSYNYFYTDRKTKTYLLPYNMRCMAVKKKKQFFQGIPKIRFGNGYRSIFSPTHSYGWESAHVFFLNIYCSTFMYDLRITYYYRRYLHEFSHRNNTRVVLRVLCGRKIRVQAALQRDNFRDFPVVFQNARKYHRKSSSSTAYTFSTESILFDFFDFWKKNSTQVLLKYSPSLDQHVKIE